MYCLKCIISLSLSCNHHPKLILKFVSAYENTYSINNALIYVPFYTSPRRFMVNLQQEVLELEFNEYSKGMPTISEIEFGKVLMRYTILTVEDQQKNLDRLAERIPDQEVRDQEVRGQEVEKIPDQCD